MNPTLIFSLCLGAASLMAPMARGQAPPGPQGDTAAAKTALDLLIEGVEARTSTITDYEARFSQTVTRKHLPRPLKRSGVVYFKKPGMMRWDYRVPERVYYISDGEVLWSYEAREKLAYKLPVKDSELYSALKFLFGQGQLREEFSIRAVAAPKGLAGLELTPLTPQSGYTKLILEVDDATYEIRSTILFDPIGNQSRVSFEGAVTSKTLKAEAFHFTPPEGVRVENLTRQRGDAP